jgi:hypothetical protein
MTGISIPENEQINAMLNGSIYDLLGHYISDPRSIDFRKYITVGRQQLVEFLQVHTDIADVYLRMQLSMDGNHDVERVFRQGSGYVVASMLHGEARWPRYFESAAEAAAQHVLMSHGMY